MSFLLKLLKPYLSWKIDRDSSKALPDYNHNFNLEGLSKKVEITRDKWAVPHIYAQNEPDLYLAQGFCHAQERLWQMELWRRIASGRLSELFGKVSLDADKLLRTLGFRRQALLDFKRLSNNLQQAETKLTANLSAYAKGVNGFLTQCQQLPAEFKLLAHQPEPWTEVDCLAIARFLSFQMSWGWHHQLEKLQMVQKIGVEKAKELFPSLNNELPMVLKNGIERNYWDWDTQLLRPLDGLFLKPTGGSNNWAISAPKMQTNSAALCNDPHLLLNNPNIWIENHLVCPESENTGVSIAGMPFVVIGHNRKIAWGATLSFVDMQDVFIEKFTSEEAKQYECGNEIKRATHFEEKIYIKKQKKPHIETVIYTHHGAIISNVLPIQKNPKTNNQNFHTSEHPNPQSPPAHYKLSLASPVLQQHDMVLGFYLLNTSNGWNDFVTACACMNAPSLNLAYADTADNIGYYCTGKVPIRKKNKHGLPVLGYTGEHEWNNFIPFDEMPHALNPSQGYLFSCNNQITDEKYPYDLGDLFMSGYRAERLKRLFAAQNSYNLENCKSWQMDFYSVAAEKWKVFIINNLDKKINSRKADLPANIFAGFELLQNWNCEMSANSGAAALYQLIIQHLIDELIGSELGEKLTAGFRGEGNPNGLFRNNEFWSHDADVIFQILNDEKSLWRKGTTVEMLWKSYTYAVEFLNHKLGQDANNWAWSKLHFINFNHALGQEQPLSDIFNLQNYPIGGDKDTLNQLSFMPNQHFGGLICGASFRQVINMGNFADCYSSAPLGQSGNKNSPHHHDQLNDWLQGNYKPIVWTREQLQEFAKYKQLFIPR
jgi:penicillin G amidase